MSSAARAFEVVARSVPANVRGSATAARPFDVVARTRSALSAGASCTAIRRGALDVVAASVNSPPGPGPRRETSDSTGPFDVTSSALTGRPVVGLPRESWAVIGPLLARRTSVSETAQFPAMALFVVTTDAEAACATAQVTRALVVWMLSESETTIDCGHG
jgi:hypothetical protein